VNDSIKRGFSFGLTSGVITTLGMIIGLNASTGSLLAIIGGIVIIALTDALSDSFGMHMSEEFSNGEHQKKVWEATFATFFFKLLFALSFVIPFLLFELNTAIVVCIIYGLLLIGIFSYYIAGLHNLNKGKVILEHLGIALIVIILTHLVGTMIRNFFV